MSKANWKFRVVKRQRGGQGEWFDHDTAATFATEGEARQYAESFAAEQTAAGVVGTAIDVRSRKGTCGFGRGELVATFRVGREP